MKILLMDQNNISDAIAQVLVREGHDLYVSNDAYGPSRWAKTIGYREDLSHVINEKWDLVVACGTNTNRDGFVEAFRERCIPTFGSGREGFRMEEKHVGRQVFSEAGLPSPRNYVYESPREALKGIPTIVREDWKGVVVKFTETNRPFRTVVCQEIEDAVRLLAKDENGEGSLVLEELVKGIEVAFACYTDGRHFIPTVTSFEHKWLFPGDMGVLTPEMGTSLFFDPRPAWTDMFWALLDSQEGRKRLQDYRGFIDINCIMNEAGELVPLEFTCRYGVPQTDIMTALLKGEGTHYGEFLLSVAKGDADPRLLWHSKEFAVGINLVVCGFPFQEIFPDICYLGSPIRGLDDLNVHHTFGSVKKVGDEILTDGAWVMNVTGTSFTSMREARLRAVAAAQKVSFQGKIYREDIGLNHERNKYKLFHANVISLDRTW